MTVQFMLSFDEKLDESMDNFATKVVEAYEVPGAVGCGYEIIEAEVVEASDCKIIGDGGSLWVASECESVPGGHTYFVTGWRKVK